MLAEVAFREPVDAAKHRNRAPDVRELHEPVPERVLTVGKPVVVSSDHGSF